LEDGNKLSIDPEGMIVNLRMDDGIPEKDIEFDFGQEEEEVEEGKDNEENEEES
jgi:adenylate kinase family enzyme